MNDGGVCRTAPATPGLLKMYALPSPPYLIGNNVGYLSTMNFFSM